MSGFAAVKGCTIQTVAPVSGGLITVLTTESQKVKAEKLGVYSGEIKVQVSGASLGSYTQSGSCVITISPKQVKKCKTEKKLMFTVGDSGITTEPQTFVFDKSSTTSNITVQITDAGQKKVKVS